jgi:hypothetical protein
MGGGFLQLLLITLIRPNLDKLGRVVTVEFAQRITAGILTGLRVVVVVIHIRPAIFVEFHPGPTACSAVIAHHATNDRSGFCRLPFRTRLKLQ